MGVPYLRGIRYEPPKTKEEARARAVSTLTTVASLLFFSLSVHLFVAGGHR
jgi:hypothetical protein